jgi:hypothetical protein
MQFILSINLKNTEREREKEEEKEGGAWRIRKNGWNWEESEPSICF